MKQSNESDPKVQKTKNAVPYVGPLSLNILDFEEDCILVKKYLPF